MPTNENKPSPLVPQGAFQSYGQGKANLKVAVFSLVTIHVLAIGGLLMLGCKPPKDTASNAESQSFAIDDLPPLPHQNDPSSLTYSNAVSNDSEFMSEFPGFGGPSAVTVNNRADSSNAVAQTRLPDTLIPDSILGPDNELPELETSSNQAVTAASNSATSSIPAPAMVEYKVVSGDTFSGIAKKHGVTLKDVVSANPDINPNRIRPGMLVNVPAEPTKSNAAASTPVSDSAAGSGGAGTYTVQRGDSLYRIATSQKTTVAKLKSANGLTSDIIKPGQVLKLP